MPDLDWGVQEVIQGGNKVVVRSRATGTPNAPLIGVDGKGKCLDILTIDIHTVENSKIVSSYHVEDCSRALELERKGWGERHPWASQNEGWEGFVMLYSANAENDLITLVQLIT